MPRRQWAWVALACALYAAIELALLSRFPIFYDEALFGAEAQLLVDHPTWTNATIAVAENHGVLQRWLAAAEIWIAGLHPLTAIRLVSMASGAVTIAAVAAIARRIDERALVTAGFVAALMPALVVHSAVGIADPLAIAATAVAAFLIIRIGEEPTLADAAWCALAIGLAVLTKKTGLLAIVLLAVGAVVAERHKPSRQKWLMACAIALAGGAVARTVLEVLTPAELREIGGRYAEAQYAGLGDSLARLPVHIQGAMSDFGGDALAYATVPLVLLAGIGAVRCSRRRPDIGVMLAFWALIPFAAAVVSANASYPRYILPLFPPLAVLAGVGMAWVADTFERRLVGPALAVAALIPAVVFDARVVADPNTAHYPGQDDWQYVTSFAAGTPWPGIARTLERQADRQPDHVVTVAYPEEAGGPVGLAAQLGRQRLVDGIIDPHYFDAQGARHRFDFRPVEAQPAAPFLLLPDRSVRALPARRLRDYRVVAVATRPHDGTTVALLARRP